MVCTHVQNPGSTEACSVVSTWSLEYKCDLSGSAGQIIPGITARVEKPDGTLAEFDEPGELVVRTPSITLGYAQNPKAYVSRSLPGGLSDGDQRYSTKETFVNG
jgi:4-coumarate--CoA ligase